MAIMIPDTCPSRATAGEKRTFGLLRDLLPDNFHAWFEPVVRGRYPDFILLADTFGLLAVEVKGWRIGEITRADDRDVDLTRVEAGEERVDRRTNPIRQVREYLFGLMDEMKRPEFAILRHPDGDHRGNLVFPCGYGVFFTDIKRAQLDAAGLSAIFPADRVVCRDELDALAGSGDREVIRRLGALFPARFDFDPMTDDQVATIKGIIHKEVVVRTRPATSASTPGGLAPPPGRGYARRARPGSGGGGPGDRLGASGDLRDRRVGQDDADPRPRPTDRRERSGKTGAHYLL